MRIIKFRAWDNLKKQMWEPSNIPQGRYGCCLFESTLMQYTGLKDNNGVGIYEGDIIKWIGGCVEAVIWEQPLGGFNISESMAIEVIGNIYENKELLTND